MNAPTPRGTSAVAKRYGGKNVVIKYCLLKQITQSTFLLLAMLLYYVLHNLTLDLPVLDSTSAMRFLQPSLYSAMFIQYTCLCFGCDYQADVGWRIYNTNKPTSVGESQKLSSRRRDVTGLVRRMSYFGCDSELEFLSND